MPGLRMSLGAEMNNILRLRIAALSAVIAALEWLRNRLPHTLYNLHRKRGALLCTYFVSEAREKSA